MEGKQDRPGERDRSDLPSAGSGGAGGAALRAGAAGLYAAQAGQERAGRDLPAAQEDRAAGPAREAQGAVGRKGVRGRVPAGGADLPGRGDLVCGRVRLGPAREQGAGRPPLRIERQHPVGGRLLLGY